MLSILLLSFFLLQCGNKTGKECERTEDCQATFGDNYVCDPTDWKCKCILECDGKCCGDSGCGYFCPDSCQPGYHCDQDSCLCEQDCTDDGDCDNIQCCHNGICTDMNCGTLECGPDQVCGLNCGVCQPCFKCELGWCVPETSVCTTDVDCGQGRCCKHFCCSDVDCTGLECGLDPVCGMDCGSCPSGHECDMGTCVIAECDPPCPGGSECLDLDGMCAPECVLPSGKLACSDDSHCPKGGACTPNNYCWYGICACIEDWDCPQDFICVNEDGGCGMCVPRGLYECGQDSDCLIAIVISRCCSLPMPRNVTTVENTPCLVEFPHEGPPPAGCEIDCSCSLPNHHDHCWPLPAEPLVVSCERGVCRLNREPGP